LGAVCSKKRKKEEGERKRRGERKIFIPPFEKIYMSSPSPPKFSKFKRGINLFKEQK
jgi:hypothetical protein